MLALGELDLHLGRQAQRDFVLDRENVVDGAVVALRPDVGAVACVDQLRGDPNAIAALANATLQYIAHAELLRRLAHVDRAPLVDEARIARDHPQPGELRQRREDVVDQAVAEMLLLRVAAHVLEGSTAIDGFSALRRRRRGPAAAGAALVAGSAARASA